MRRSRLCRLGWAVLATACAHGIEADPRAFDERGGAAGSAGWPAGGGGAGAGGVQSDGGGRGGNAGAADAGMGGRRSDAGVVCGATIPPKSTWVATASVNGSLAPLAVDADTSTRYTTGRSQAGDEWLQVDFGITATIDEVT